MILWLALFFLTITAANVFFWPRVTHRKAEGRLAILIPARNEEANLLEADLLENDWPGMLSYEATLVSYNNL